MIIFSGGRDVTESHSRDAEQQEGSRHTDEREQRPEDELSPTTPTSLATQTAETRAAAAYPPFSLARTGYPADFDVDYPEARWTQRRGRASGPGSTAP